MSSKQFKDDDKVLHQADVESFWNRGFRTPNIISKDGEFAGGTAFALTEQEATQLKRCYASILPDGGLSLISHLLDLGARGDATEVEFAWPWDVPGQPVALRRVTEHARHLSLLARGAELQYHAMLFAKKKAVDPGTRGAFCAWWEEAKTDIRGWNVDDFAMLPCVARAPRLGDVAFLKEWRSAIANASTASSAYLNANARDLLARREAAMRSHKARLRGGYYLKTWNAPTDYDPEEIYSLSYRHSVGTRFAVDITRGLRQPRSGS